MHNTDASEHTSVSTGAGIAIAGVWLSGAATTITILFIAFVLSPPGESADTETSGLGVLVLIIVISAPMIAAFNATKLILGRDT